MPNHIENLLKIHYRGSEPGRIAAIRERIGSPERALDFDRFFPYPEPFRSQDEAAEEWMKENPGKWVGRPVDGYNQGGFEWCRAAWGTKWNAYEVRVEAEEAWKLVIRFQTAWSWPEPVIRALLAEISDVDVTCLAAGEGDFFAVFIERRDDGFLREQVWHDANDSGRLVRRAVAQALNVGY